MTTQKTLDPHPPRRPTSRHTKPLTTIDRLEQLLSSYPSLAVAQHKISTIVMGEREFISLIGHHIGYTGPLTWVLTHYKGIKITLIGNESELRVEE